MVINDERDSRIVQAEYGRVLSDIESRKAAFLAAKESVDQHNREADQGLHTYYKHVNAFSVMVTLKSLCKFANKTVYNYEIN